MQIIYVTSSSWFYKEAPNKLVKISYWFSAVSKHKSFHCKIHNAVNMEIYNIVNIKHILIF